MNDQYRSSIIFIILTLSPVVDSTLKLVNLVYRHGDRSPVEVFPSDKEALSKWPDGLGWLSNIGKNDQYKLGQFLKKRYVDAGFMNGTYDHREIKVNSSNVDRCLMSAYSNLAGFFPPNGSQLWNPELRWQPIPVHTRPDSEDGVLEESAPCPEYYRILEEIMSSKAIKEEEVKNKEFYRFIANKTGYANESIDTIWSVYDTLLCERAHNITWPSWVTDKIYKKVHDLDEFQFKLLFEDKRLHRLKGGPLLKIMVENMKDKLSGPPDSLSRMFMFSGHDTTVASLMMALGVYNNISPPYAACLIIELHEDNNKSYVEIFYRNETKSLYKLQLTGCSVKCPFQQFLNLTAPSIPNNLKKECGLETGSKSRLSLAVVAAISAGGTAVFLLIVIGLAYCCIRRRSHQNYSLLAYT